MSRPKKDITKLSEQGVVTEEALVAYLNDKLTVDEKQELEKLLKDDPFAQEALEGLQSAQNKAAMAGALTSLNKKVRERSGLKEHKRALQIHWTNYAWAAVILGLLIGIGFVMIGYLGKNGGGNMAMNKKPETTGQAALKPEQKLEELKPAPTAQTFDTVTSAFEQKTDNQNNGSANVLSDKNKSKPGETQPLRNDLSKSEAQNADGKKPPSPIILPPVSGTSTTINTKATTINSTVTANTDEAPTPRDKGITANFYSPQEQPVAKEKTTWKGDPKVGYYGNAADSISVAHNYALNQEVVSAKVTKNEKKEAEKVVQLDDAMKSFNSGDYKTASEDFDKVLKHEPDNPDALYYGGICDYIDGKLPKSEKSFDKLLKKGTKYVDGAKWYKANILIKQGSVDQGKNLLQELANSSGSYKERAVKKMADLGF